MSIMSVIMTVGIGLVLLYVVFLINAKIRNKMPTDEFTENQNGTLDDLDTTTQDSFSMTGLALFALPVVALIGVIIAIAR
ncbi:MAG: hypothetical protein ACOC80_00700 [Petrotogales bacterium]